MSEVLLSLCVEALNSQDSLRATLKSVAPLTSDLAVVVPAEAPDVRDVCREHGARVVEFRGPSDAGAALNECLRSAAGAWALTVTAGESMSAEDGERLLSILGAREGAPAGYAVDIQRKGDLGCCAVRESVRLFRNEARHRLEGRARPRPDRSISAAGGAIGHSGLRVWAPSGATAAGGLAGELDLLVWDLEETPDCPWSLCALGEVLCEIGQFERAVGVLSRALLGAPLQVRWRERAWVLVVHAYRALGRSGTARVLCSRALESEPSAPGLLLQRAQLLRERSEDDGAEAQCAAALSAAYARGRPGEMQVIEAGAWRLVAEIASSRKQWDRARSAWARVVAAAPEDLDAWNELGRIGSSGGESAPRRSVAEDPSAAAGLLAAWELLRQGRCTEALELMRPHEGGERGTWVLRWLARVAFEHGELQRAEELLRALCRREPRDASHPLNLAAAMLKLGRYESAQEFLRVSLALRPGYPVALRLQEAVAVEIQQPHEPLLTESGAMCEQVERWCVDGFYHVATIGSWRSVVEEQVGRLRESSLYERMGSLRVCAVGPEAGEVGWDDPKIEVVGRYSSLEEYEFPTLRALQRFCCGKEGAVFYFHTKGVSRTDPSVRDWRRYMEYFVIERWSECLAGLGGHDTMGVNWMRAPWPHFSGNFWWARCKYIASLPAPDSCPPGEQDGSRRHWCERWVGRGVVHRAGCLHQSNVDHYKVRYPEERYTRKESAEKRGSG